MREVDTYPGAYVELRADEVVYADLHGMGFRQVTIINDEDGLTPEQKRRLRREKRGLKYPKREERP